MRLRLVLALALMAGVGAGGAAAVAPPRRVLPPRERRDAIADYASRLRLGPAQRHGSLVLFPVLASGVRVPEVDLTLDKAMDLGVVDIRELKPADVNRVRVRNRAKRPIFVMAGEMLKDARQDRIVGDDLILPPGKEITVRVFCVEHGRWVAKTEEFKSGRAMAQASVRLRARAGQEAVWSQVADEQERLSAPSETGALRSVRESPEVQGKIRPYTHALSDLPDDFPRACGVVATVGGEILAADLFSSPAIFRQLWPKLLESYVIDSLDRPGMGRRPEASWVRRWLERLGTARQEEKRTPGLGTLYELEGRGLVGSALVWDRGVVHMGAFPTASIAPVDYNALKFRRERLGEGE